MVSNAELIEVIADKLREYKACNIVMDPVIAATSGSRLFVDSAMQTLIDRLFPLADVITPNIPEAEAISGRPNIHTAGQMLDAAKDLAGRVRGCVLIKGGHLQESADDLLYLGDEAHWFRGCRVDNPNTHGTGCTLSSAIACNLAVGLSLIESIQNAKEYVTDALRCKLDLGRGSGPLNHCCRM